MQFYCFTLPTFFEVWLEFFAEIVAFSLYGFTCNSCDASHVIEGSVSHSI